MTLALHSVSRLREAPILFDLPDFTRSSLKNIRQDASHNYWRQALLHLYLDCCLSVIDFFVTYPKGQCQDHSHLMIHYQRHIRWTLSILDSIWSACLGWTHHFHRCLLGCLIWPVATFNRCFPRQKLLRHASLQSFAFLLYKSNRFVCPSAVWSIWAFLG